MSKEVRRAAEILRAGGLVAFPTETVYGLGADASSEKAVARLYAVKGRPAAHPVIVHFSSAEKAFEWGKEIPESARKLGQEFWPGPLTLILTRSAMAKDFVTGGQPSVGVRVPSHPVARELLKEFGKPIAAPSANRFGRVSPTTVAHVHEDLGGDVDLVLEGGASEVGIESTIVDLSSGTAMVLRPGKISAAELGKVVSLGRGRAAPRHSGGMEKHYAPKNPARLVATHDLDREISELKARAAVLAFSRPDERVDFWLRMPRDPALYAQKLYASLRELDGTNCDAILIEAPPAGPGWEAVLDRLKKATA
ncbi:MAG TPA: L-threonylcarbamoyladenylate synthase, partial [Burkholderiales bacterium]|nr:L-threonylcarbamoyladenylate synthase [Burkholderiales bacterium]